LATRMKRTMKAVAGYILLYPVLLPLTFYLAWAAGRFELGHWPVPSLDDPKYIGGLVDVTYWIVSATLFGFPVCVISIGFLLLWSFSRVPERKSYAFYSLAGLVLLLVMVAFMRWDPHRVVEWYFD